MGELVFFLLGTVCFNPDTELQDCHRFASIKYYQDLLQCSTQIALYKYEFSYLEDVDVAMTCVDAYALEEFELPLSKKGEPGKVEMQLLY